MENQTKYRMVRKPSTFAAIALFLLAAVGKYTAVSGLQPIVRWLGGEIAPEVERLIIDAGYEFFFLLLPVMLYFRTLSDQPMYVNTIDVWNETQEEGSGSTELNEILPYARRPDDMTQRMDAIRNVRRAPIRPMDALICWAAAVVGTLLSVRISNLWMIAIDELGGVIPSTHLAVPTTLSSLLLSFIFVCVFPGVCEEALFRGVVLGAWEERGSMRAIFVSTLLFTSLHGSIVGLPTELLLGAVMGYIVIATGSLYGSIIYHITHNATLIALAYLSSHYADPAMPVVDPIRYYDYFGGAVGIAMILIQLLLLGTIYFYLLRALCAQARREKRRVLLPAPPEWRPMDWRGTIVVMAAVVTIVYLYLDNFLIVLGVLR